MPEYDAGAIPAGHPIDAAHAVTAERLFAAIWSLSVLGTIIGVGRHDADALADLTPNTLVLGERLAAIPFQAWIYAGTHLLAGLASLALGYLAVSFAYPRRHLAREAHVNPAAAIQASAHLLGAAVISTVSWGGCDAPSLLISSVFCLLGWLSLAAICAGHRVITRYADHEEIAHGNVAAALASAGLHLGVALVVGHAIQGQFTGWASSLTANRPRMGPAPAGALRGMRIRCAAGGVSGWVDMTQGLRAFRCRDVTSVVVVEEDARAKNLVYRWKPKG